MLKEPRLGEQAQKLCFIFGLRHSPRDRGRRAWPAAVRQPDAHSAPLAPPRGLLYSLRPFEGTRGQRTRRSPGDPAQGHGARPPFAQPGLRVLHECILFRREAAEAMAAFLEHTLPAFWRVASGPSAGHHRSLVPSRASCRQRREPPPCGSFSLSYSTSTHPPRVNPRQLSFLPLGKVSSREDPLCQHCRFLKKAFRSRQNALRRDRLARCPPPTVRDLRTRRIRKAPAAIIRSDV